jgi:hypothetical protein
LWVPRQDEEGLRYTKEKARIHQTRSYLPLHHPTRYTNIVRPSSLDPRSRTRLPRTFRDFFFSFRTLCVNGFNVLIFIYVFRGHIRAPSEIFLDHFRPLNIFLSFHGNLSGGTKIGIEGVVLILQSFHDLVPDGSPFRAKDRDPTDARVFVIHLGMSVSQRELEESQGRIWLSQGTVETFDVREVGLFDASEVRKAADRQGVVEHRRFGSLIVRRSRAIRTASSFESGRHHHLRRGSPSTRPCLRVFSLGAFRLLLRGDDLAASAIVGLLFAAMTTFLRFEKYRKPRDAEIHTLEGTAEPMAKAVRAPNCD